MHRALFVVLVGCGRLSFDDQASGTHDGSVTGDVRPTIDATPGSFCAMHPHVFCTDFTDDPWDDTVAEFGSAIPTAGSLIVTTQGISSGQVVRVQKIANNLGTSNKATLTFTLDAQHVGSGDPVIAYLQMNDGTTYHALEYIYRAPPMTSYLEEGIVPVADSTAGTYTNYDFAGAAANEEHVLSMTIDLAVPDVSTSIDGTVVMTHGLATNSGGGVQLVLGVPYLAGAADAWTFKFDDVFVAF